MDSESVYVRPSEVFSSMHPDMGTKTPQHPLPFHTWQQDEKFLRYESSPESVASYSDETTFSPIDDDSSRRSGKLLHTIRRSLFPYQDLVDSHPAPPIQMNALSEELALSYLTDYSENVYGFNPSLGPHPMAVILSSAMTNPAAFHLVLARTAQYRLCWNKFNTQQQHRDLEFALMGHKAEAFQLIRAQSGQAAHGQQVEDLMAAIIGLGTLDSHAGAGDVASMHFAAVRQLLKSIGGHQQLQSMWLSRIMVHFECGYGATTESYIWDRSDFGSLHTELNGFFSKLWSVQNAGVSPTSRRSSLTQTTVSSPGQQNLVISLKQQSLLYDCLARRTGNLSDPTQHDRSELIFQLTCLLTLCTVMVDLHSDPAALESYMDSIHDLVTSSQSQNNSVNNILWLLQIHDHSIAHSKRVWAAAGWVWVLRHVNFNVQGMIRDWLLAVLTGKPVPRALKLDSFAFSYAS